MRSRIFFICVWFLDVCIRLIITWCMLQPCPCYIGKVFELSEEMGDMSSQLVVDALSPSGNGMRLPVTKRVIISSNASAATVGLILDLTCIMASC